MNASVQFKHEVISQHIAEEASRMVSNSANLDGDYIVRFVDGLTVYEELDVIHIDLSDDGIGGA